jgi:insulysin
MGNVNEEEAKSIAQLIDTNFLSKARPLEHEEIPRLRSLKMPTMVEAERIFGPEVRNRSIPIIIEEVTQNEGEENHAVEVIIQVGSEHELGFKGIAVLELISQMAYNSAFSQLRTKEQLGESTRVTSN